MSHLSHRQSKHVSSSVRERGLKAAFALFRENGFSSTSMLDIVTQARISKRDLYALLDNKHAVFAAGISKRAQQMRWPLETTTPVPQSRDALAALLVEFGVSISKTVSDPKCWPFFVSRLQNPIAPPRSLEYFITNGHEANRKAQATGLILAGDPAVRAACYLAVLWGDLLVRLLMRVCDTPNEK